MTSAFNIIIVKISLIMLKVRNFFEIFCINGIINIGVI